MEASGSRSRFDVTDLSLSQLKLSNMDYQRTDIEQMIVE
jgi:hypothetical protein